MSKSISLTVVPAIFAIVLLALPSQIPADDGAAVAESARTYVVYVSGMT